MTDPPLIQCQCDCMFFQFVDCIRFHLQEDRIIIRRYYPSMRRNEEVINVRDAVLLKSGPRKKDLPFVARVSAIWEDDEGLFKPFHSTLICFYSQTKFFLQRVRFSLGHYFRYFPCYYILMLMKFKFSYKKSYVSLITIKMYTQFDYSLVSLIFHVMHT